VSAKLRSILTALTGAAALAPAATAAAVLAPAATAAEGNRAAAQEAPPARECADADLEPAPESVGRVRAAILCLHNRVRAEHDLPALRENPRLRRAAVGHSRHMVAGGFFEHTTPAGVTMVDRILRARYVRRDQGWAVGENLAWGTGAWGTPRGAVQAWMDSPGHRANILRRDYRELGVGVVLGVPVSDAAGATYTVDFGGRR
jgi:uncharacterized protein YkwD